ncbi:MBL fold metallo-hydrolase [Actinospica sp.]|jgi:glyoxylase-like metal-dependent hydrolase (beta-lactamase superfamily II)|uniref:MBL fold metallo-hydrolase n=1 Tax=Actinospica sp. TaxID=1872142 RepID=UPI002CC2BAB8|nr:MBL fold metallo-hydrolase [Actinospica sp.]HWG26004.1 MBL fold metallo-hydrolase [Actinospica sp.]
MSHTHPNDGTRRRAEDPEQVAPGVHRLGDEVVNFYLIEHEDGLVLVDAGLPGHFGLLQERVARLGYSLTDIRAVLLTHGHLDHTGLAERLRAEAGAEIWIHREDAPILADGPRSAMRHAKPERSMLPYLLRRPAAIRTPLHMARSGAFTAPKVQEFSVLPGEQPLDTVPGRPQPVLVPGHTSGSVAYHFADRGLLFTGDALVTADGMTGHTGPSLVCRGFTHDGAAALASLDRIAALPQALILPGHGRPFADGPRAAADQARHVGMT